jgi:hypothetical protein
MPLRWKPLKNGLPTNFAAPTDSSSGLSTKPYAKAAGRKRRNPQKQQTNNFHHFQPSHHRTRHNSRQKSYRLERITRLALTDNFIHETSSAFTERTTYTQHLAACKSKAENGIYLNFKLRHSRTYFLKYRNEPTCGTTCF